MNQHALHPARTSASKRWRHVIAAVLIFVGGGVFGAVVTGVVITRAIRHVFEHPESAGKHVASRLASFLDLNDRQAEQVQEIIARRHAALGDIRREIQPRLEAELTILEKEIDGVLDEKQKVKWHEHTARFRAEWLPPLPASTEPAAR